MASKLKAKDPVSAAPSKPKVLIFGKPGIGKTWAALDFPSVFYIDVEGGANLPHYSAKLSASKGVYLGPEDGACDFNVVIDQVKALASETHPYRTLVIDSISKLFNTAVALEADRLGSKNAFGADKKPAVAAMRQLVIWLQKLDMNVVLISHEKVEWGVNDKGERCEVGATFDAWDRLAYDLHLVLRVVKRGASRKAFVQKSRLTGFADGASIDWSFDSFAEAYGREAISGEVKTVPLATQDQVAEVVRLLEVVKLEDDFSQKCFAKAGASSWGDLDSDQIGKVIKLLLSKVSGVDR